MVPPARDAMADEENERSPLTDEDIVEIYAAGSDVEADRIVLLLEEQGVDAQRRETSVPVFPGATYRHLITVLAHDREKSVTAIRQAIEDGILPADGTFL